MLMSDDEIKLPQFGHNICVKLRSNGRGCVIAVFSDEIILSSCRINKLERSLEILVQSAGLLPRRKRTHAGLGEAPPVAFRGSGSDFLSTGSLLSRSRSVIIVVTGTL